MKAIEITSQRNSGTGRNWNGACSSSRNHNLKLKLQCFVSSEASKDFASSLPKLSQL
jgi:hypothetical protein